MGNILAGHRLIKRVAKEDVYGITLPILTTRAGEKFGKSADNAIWLDAKKTTEFSLYQFFIRVPDDDVERLLKMLTTIPVKEIEEIMAESRKAAHLLISQKRLAEYITILIHGSESFEFFSHIFNKSINRMIFQKRDSKKPNTSRPHYTLEISQLWQI